MKLKFIWIIWTLFEQQPLQIPSLVDKSAYNSDVRELHGCKPLHVSKQQQGSIRKICEQTTSLCGSIKLGGAQAH